MTDLLLNITIRAANQASPVFGQVAQSVASINPLMGTLAAGAVAAGAVVAAFGVASVNAASDFQAAMIKSQAEAGLTKQQMLEMGQAVLQMAPQVGQAPKDLAAGLFFVESAGFAGKNALDALRLSAQMAASDMSDTSTVAKGLTTAVKAFGYDTSQSTFVANQMTVAVSSGKMTMEQYAASIGKVALTAHGFHVSMGETNAGLATLTNNGFPSAATAATGLNALLLQFDGNTTKIAKNMQGLGLSFDAQKFRAMDLQHQIEYLNTALQGHDDSLKKILGGSQVAASAFKALRGDVAGYKDILDKLNKAQEDGGAQAKAFAATQEGVKFKVQQLNATLQVAMINIGNALLPMVGQAIDVIRQIIDKFNQWESRTHAVENAAKVLSGGIQTLVGWVRQSSDFVQKNEAALYAWKGALTAASIVVGVGLVAAFYALASAAWTAAAGVIAATWPVLAVAAAIGLLVAGFLWLYNNVAPFRNVMNQVGQWFTWLWGVIVTNVHPALQQLWSFLVTSFAPVWQQMIVTWNTQLIPAWNDLVKAIHPIMPQLQQFAQFLGIVVGGSIIIVIGYIGAMVGALGGLLTGIAIIIGGIVTWISGAIQAISGIISLFVDIFTGRWDKLGSDLTVISGGIIKMYIGMWQSIQGVFVGAINAIIGLMNGFMAGIIGPLNTVLVASGKAAISVGQIPMLTVAPSGGFAVMPTYKPLGPQRTSLPNTANIPSIGNLPKMPTIAQPTPVAIPSASLAPITDAIGSASGKSSANALKSQQAADVRAQKLADQQNKALAASNSSQVRALVDQSKQAQASGNMALAAYDAQKAATLASQQHAAAQRDAHKQQTTQHHAQVVAAAAARHKQTLAAHAAKLAQNAAHHKALIDAIIGQECPGATVSLPSALGVALPNYATHTGYVQQNAPTQQYRGMGGTTTHHQHIEVHIHSNSKEAKEHGRQAAEAAKKELAKQLRSGGITPRYTSGGR